MVIETSRRPEIMATMISCIVPDMVSGSMLRVLREELEKAVVHHVITEILPNILKELDVEQIKKDAHEAIVKEMVRKLTCKE